MKKKKQTTKNYSIRESIHGNFFYHIALEDQVLCGKTNTMLTRIPLSAWGVTSHLHEKYCKECCLIFDNISKGKNKSS